MSRHKRAQQQRHRRNSHVTRLRVDMNGLNAERAKHGECAHGRIGGFACPHCHGIGIPGQAQHTIFLDERGEPTDSSFTATSPEPKVYRIHRLDGTVEEF